MGDRLELHARLTDILGSPNVYFQPPESIKLSYPCIIYERTPEIVKHADNLAYLQKNKYSLTIIDKNPDTTIPNAIGRLPFCRMNRVYVSENLNHYNYEIYF